MPPIHSQTATSTSSLNRRDFLLTAGALSALAMTPTFAADNKKWRVAVIGHTGHGNYGHGLDTVWLSVPESEIVGFADADHAGRDKQQKKLPGVPAFASYTEMLKELKPDIVAIGPRHITEHRDMMLAAAEAGARGIYSEKPFCRTPAEADEIIAACEKSGTLVSLAHRNRFHPVLPVVIQAIQDGLIGELLEVRSRGKEDQRGGCLDLWVLGSHDLDLALPITGKAVACSSVIQKENRPATRADLFDGDEGVGPILGDRLHARFELESGIPHYFDSIKNKGVREANFGVQFIGNKGIVDLRIDVEPLAHFVPGNPFRPTNESRPWIPITTAGVGKKEVSAEIGRNVANHVIPVRDLFDAITNKRPPLSNAETGRQVVDMIHAVYTSHVQDGARIELPLQNREHGLSPWLNS